MRRAIAVGLWAVVALGGCEGDPNDPQTWIKKLDEGALREKAVDELTRIYTDTLNSKNGNAGSGGSPSPCVLDTNSSVCSFFSSRVL